MGVEKGVAGSEDKDGDVLGEGKGRRSERDGEGEGKGGRGLDWRGREGPVRRNLHGACIMAHSYQQAFTAFSAQAPPPSLLHFLRRPRSP